MAISAAKLRKTSTEDLRRALEIGEELLSNFPSKGEVARQTEQIREELKRREC